MNGETRSNQGYEIIESARSGTRSLSLGKMTSKSPVRSAEDVDEVALFFAEVKCLPQVMKDLRKKWIS